MYDSRLVAKRGRKPLNLRHLDQLDRECFKAFHRLSKGTPLPLTVDEAQRQERYLEECEVGELALLKNLRQMTARQVWIEFEGGSEASFLDQRGFSARAQVRAVGNSERAIRDTQDQRAELRAVIKELTSHRNIVAHTIAARVWRSLWLATTAEDLTLACQKWDALPKRYTDPSISAQILAHAAGFLRMKEDVRFPGKAASDDGRIAYLSAGLAGLIVGASPLTSIERIRKFTHRKGHPLWKAGLCTCWRCVLDRRSKPRPSIIRKGEWK